MLTPEQEDAVELAITVQPRVACLTGGPGTGKTYTVNEILDAAREHGLSYALAAPSGKAAQRMEEATGRSAKTLHRLLGLLPGEWTPEPITKHLVIVDEASMIDTRLMAALASACFEGGGRVRTLLLVGDADQLPPVGPGQPFHDLLASDVCPTVRLTQVQRQSQKSGIVRAAYAVRRGDVPQWAHDCGLVEVDAAEEIASVVWGILEGLDPDDSQVLAAQRTHAPGTEALNEWIESARSSKQQLGEDCPRVRGLGPGQKVIHTKNNYDLEVYNGELGWVQEVFPADNPQHEELEVEIAGELKTYRGSTIKQLEPAWALTVHKSQGSEWRDVILVAHRSHHWMLTRSLLYVALTRARKRVWVVGQREAVEKAVKTVRDVTRDTFLREELRRRVG